MVRQLGTPTWFCSFSAADRRWPEICAAINKQQGKEAPENPDWFTHCQIINSNPVTACRMFENRVQNFITKVIMSTAQPIGQVTDYFFRTEFQSRGWQHIHCLFWCESAPKYDSKSDNKDFLTFVDRYVSCSKPDEVNEPVLHEAASAVQMHSRSHSPSCRKTGKVCRFHFPRPPSTRTFVAEPSVDPGVACPELAQKAAVHLLEQVWKETDKSTSNVKAEDILAKTGITQEAYEKVLS